MATFVSALSRSGRSRVAPGRTPIVITRGGAVPPILFAAVFAVFGAGAGASVCVAVALLGGIGGAFSLIVHEFGHVRAARRLNGVRVRDVSLMWLGAATHLDGAYGTGREQARVAASGPGASFAFAFGLVACALLPVPGYVRYGVLGLALLNVAIALLSLLPVNPLDGYKLIVGLVWCAVGSERQARRIVKRVGIAFVAVDVSATALLTVQRPGAGVIATAIAMAAFGQRHIAARGR